MINIVAKKKKNLQIQSTIDHLRTSKEFCELSKYIWVKVTDTIELKALFGMMYFRDLLGSDHNSVKSLFSDTQSCYVFSAVMSKKCVKLLLGHVTFDHHQEREEKWNFDSFAAIRTVSGCLMTPSEYLQLDETLCHMHHQIDLRQYNQNELNHYELLFKSLNDACFPYTYKSVQYALKAESGKGTYYINSTIYYKKNLITRTEGQQNLNSPTFSTDRLNTSVQITKWLLERNMTTVETVQKGQHGIPLELFGVRD